MSCSHPGGCGRCGSYGRYSNGIINNGPRYCKYHRQGGLKGIENIDFVDRMAFKCKNPGCIKNATFGKFGATPTLCILHFIKNTTEDISSMDDPTEDIMSMNLEDIISNMTTSELVDYVAKTARAYENRIKIQKEQAYILKIQKRDAIIEQKKHANILKIQKQQAKLIQYYNKQILPKSKQRLIKQTNIFEYLDCRNLKGDSDDKQIPGGGKERPDRIYYFYDIILIVECDEHQHKKYKSDAEISRMSNIQKSLTNERPVYFIRFNPDPYIPAPNCKVVDIRARHQTLGDIIENIRDGYMELPNAPLSACYMYYDGFDSVNSHVFISLV
jgi:hypothetical protein